MDPVEKERRPSVAALLSLLAPGLGQLYNGQVRRALLFFGAWAALYILLVTTIDPTRSVLPLSLLILQLSLGLMGMLVRIASAVDAFFQSRIVKVINPRWFNRWYLYAVAALVVGMATINPPRRYAEPFPSLQIDDHFSTLERSP